MFGRQTVAQPHGQIQRLLVVHRFKCSLHAQQYTTTDREHLLFSDKLLGDAAHCPSLLTGQGSTLAMMGAYILAGELQATSGEHRQAFQQYEQAFRPVISKEQKKIKSGGDFLVPGTPLSLWTRNHLSPVLAPFIMVPGGIWNRFFPQPSLVKDYVSLSKKEA